VCNWHLRRTTLLCKNIKNHINDLVSNWLLASHDTLFQKCKIWKMVLVSNQLHDIYFQKRKKSTLKIKYSNQFYKNYVISNFSLWMEIRRSEVRPCRVHFKNVICKQFYKELRNHDFSFLMRIRRSKVNPCRVLFNRKICMLNNFLFLIFGKINIIK